MVNEDFPRCRLCPDCGKPYGECDCDEPVPIVDEETTEGYPEEHSDSDRERVKKLMKEIKGVNIYEL